jgi:hypothetical protein
MSEPKINLAAEITRAVNQAFVDTGNTHRDTVKRKEPYALADAERSGAGLSDLRLSGGAFEAHFFFEVKVDEALRAKGIEVPRSFWQLRGNAPNMGDLHADGHPLRDIEKGILAAIEQDRQSVQARRPNRLARALGALVPRWGRT